MTNEIKIITKNWGQIPPGNIEAYVGAGGYDALRRFIAELDGSRVIDEIKRSKLCGRGGAGFSTGDKLDLVARQKGEKYFICNLDESEPGTYKDRSIVDNDPFLLLEGITISALAIGAKKAYVYINGHYRSQREMLENCISQAYTHGYLGHFLLNSSYNLEIEVCAGAGAYVCGEETALLSSMEGLRGEPRMRPPYPTDKGLADKPTAVNNAETITNIPWIVQNGGEAYAALGSSLSPGVKLYILGGAVNQPQVIEAPTGITIRELIYDLGGGIVKGKEFWFAQVGGASGRLATEDELDTSLTYDRTSPIPMGSGSILVVDTSVNLYELLLSWTGFFRRESCGKCVPCREGTFRLHEIAARLADGEISERDKQAMKDILWTLNNTTFCPLGKFAATAVNDAIEKLGLLDS
jgi:NADH:ubiquinone oxidoreductase subunit F (NADH-binding)